MPAVKIYLKTWCPWCHRACDFFASRSIPFEQIDVEEQPGLQDEIAQKTGHSTVPMIYIGEHFVGGYSELVQLANQGKLEELLN